MTGMELIALRADLKADRFPINTYLEAILGADASSTNGLVQEAIQYAVLGPAQRIRPILAVRVGRMLGAPEDVVLRAASAVELLHCASLIIDDLPCMDDSPLRRDQPSAHVQFGEATAVLAAFGLVALAARTVVEYDCPRPFRERLRRFQLQLLRSLDCAGLIAGQALDLQLANERDRRTQAGVTELKTVPLFSLAVLAGLVGSDLDGASESRLRQFGKQFGLAFQMSDDLLDGDVICRAKFEERLFAMREAIQPFGPDSRELEELIDYLHVRVSDYYAN